MKVRLIALALLFGTLAGCHSANTGKIQPEEKTTLRVDNQGFADMDIFALHSSQRVRLGMAPGHSNTVFDVPRVLVTGLTSLRFIADPIGATRASVSEEITVAPGDSVVLTIPPI